MTAPVHTLAELRAFERKLGAAIASPLKSAMFDDFKKETLPYSELAQRLDWVRRQIAAHPDTVAAPSAPRNKFIGIRPGCGL